MRLPTTHYPAPTGSPRPPLQTERQTPRAWNARSQVRGGHPRTPLPAKWRTARASERQGRGDARAGGGGGSAPLPMKRPCLSSPPHAPPPLSPPPLAVCATHPYRKEGKRHVSGLGEGLLKGLTGDSLWDEYRKNKARHLRHRTRHRTRHGGSAWPATGCDGR